MVEIIIRVIVSTINDLPNVKDQFYDGIDIRMFPRTRCEQSGITGRTTNVVILATVRMKISVLELRLKQIIRGDKGNNLVTRNIKGRNTNVVIFAMVGLRLV